SCCRRSRADTPESSCTNCGTPKSLVRMQAPRNRGTGVRCPHLLHGGTEFIAFATTFCMMSRPEKPIPPSPNYASRRTDALWLCSQRDDGIEPDYRTKQSTARDPISRIVGRLPNRLPGQNREAAHAQRWRTAVSTG